MSKGDEVVAFRLGGCAPNAVCVDQTMTMESVNPVGAVNDVSEAIQSLTDSGEVTTDS